MKTLRHTLTTVGLALTTLLTPALTTGCQDDPLFSAPGYDGEGTATKAELENPGPLQRNGSGRWVASRQVPLVGVGRIADDIGNSLVKLFDFNSSNGHSLDCMFDDDLNNYAELKGSLLDGDVLAGAAVSVKDIYHTYEANQKVGFVIQPGSNGVIDIDVLETFFIETYLDGKLQQSLGGKDQSTSLLNIDLFTPANSEKQTIAAEATMPFDEIRLCIGGVNVNVLSGMRIYYAFVGENEEHVITKGEYSNATIKKTGNWGVAGWFDNSEKFWDADDAGPTYGVGHSNPGLILDLGSGTIPAGSEVGFKLTTGGVLNLDLFSNTEFAYTYKDGTKKTITIKDGIGIGLLGGGGQTISAIPEDKTKDIIGMEIKINIITLPVLGTLLNGGSISYSYYRDPAEIDPSYYFGIGNDTISTNSYRLPKPEYGSVAYDFLGCNAGEGAEAAVASEKDSDGNDTGYQMLYGMSGDGNYYMKATYTAPNNPDGTPGEQIEYFFTIRRETRDMPTSCHTPITKGTYENASTYPGNDGCLLCIGTGNTDVEEGHGSENVVDANTNNYAGTVGAIQVASNMNIVNVDAGEEIGINGEMRVGFVLQNVNQFLNLNALRFFTIKVKGEDDEIIAEGTPHENEGVGLGLLGSSGDKIRYSIKVDKPFQSVELYHAGLLDVDLSVLRVYYAFWEDASDESCTEIVSSGIPGDACISMISAQQNHADIDYAATGGDGIANALNPISYENLGKAIDANRNTAARIPTGINVGGEITLGIKFDDLDANQAIGIIVRKPTGVLGIDALSKGTTIQAFYDDDAVSQNEGAGFQTAGVKLFGSGDRYALEITPTQKFNRIKISFAEGLIQGLDDFLFYGVYYRPDSDGDGIPDCSENPNEEESDGLNLSLQTTDVCEGDPIVINAVAGVGKPNQEDFYLRFLLSRDSNPSATKEVIIPVLFDKDKQQLVAKDPNVPLILNQYGIYSGALYKSNTDFSDENKVNKASTLLLTVHNEATTWTGNIGDYRWNSWDNWTHGSPWTCTNVTIPGGLGDNYPFLLEDEYNACANLYIEDGGQLVNSFYLDEYDYVWVDIALESGRYYMLTSPLTDMVSGDWFFNTEKDNNWTAFTQLDNQSYPEKRINPTIYQRLWSTNAPVKVPEGYGSSQTVAPDETHWTPPYNSVAQKYGLGMGFSLMADKATGQNYTFRFPKTHTEYNYFNLAGDPSGQSETITRNKVGHFAYEDAYGNGTVTVPVSQPDTDVNACLVGNPFVAHVDLEDFMQENGISEVKVFDGTSNTNNSLILVDGELVSSNNASLTNIKPMEAFFVMNYTGKSVKFTDGMLNAGSSEAFTRSAAPSRPGTALRLAATRDGHTAHALLRVSPGASADVVPGEDTQLLVEGEACPAVAVYTVAGGRALDIQQVPEGPAAIPLGFYLPDGGKADIRLTLDFTDPQWTDWFLVDQRTGQRQRITHTTITLHGVESGSGQYALMRNEE